MKEIGRVSVKNQIEPFVTSYTAMTRYLILVNGGGAVATSAFLGSTISSGHSSKWFVLPLVFFYLGLFLAGFLVFGQLTSQWTLMLRPEERGLAIQKGIATRIGNLAERPGKWFLSSLIFFLLGGAAGVISYICVA